MKKTAIKLFCLVMATIMILCLAGCSSSNNKLIDDAGVEKFDIEGNPIVDNGDATASDNQDATSSGDKGSSGGKVTAAAVPNADKLTWKQLVSQIPKELKGTTVTMYNWNDSVQYTGSEKVFKDFEKQTGIKIKWVVGPYDGYTTNIAAMVNAGNSPDLIRMYNNDIHRMYLCQNVKEATGFDFKGDIWDQGVNKAYTIKGKVYAVNRQNTFWQQPKVFMYKKSVIEELKLDDPYVIWKQGKWTWEAFEKLAKEYKQLKPNGNAWISYNGVDYKSFSGLYFFEIEDGKYVNKQNDQEVYKTLQKMCNLYSQGILSNAMRDQKVFQNNSVLFMTFNSIANRRTNANLVEVKGEGDLYCVPIPTIKGREKVQEYSELEAYGIPKGAKNAPATYYFLRYFLDGDNYDANEVFCNKQAYDVFVDARKKTEYYADTDSELLVAVDKNGSSFGGLSQFTTGSGTVAQLKAKLDENKPLYDLAVKKANEILAKFK